MSRADSVELKIPSELVMRAARLIVPYWDTSSRNERRNAIITARAVIEALKDPPGNVIDALFGLERFYDGRITDGWNEVIDVALGKNNN